MISHTRRLAIPCAVLLLAALAAACTLVATPVGDILARPAEFEGKDVTVAGAVQNVSTTTEALSVVDVTSPGIASFINLTSGSEVQVGQMSGGTFVPVLQLEYGEPAVARMATTALYAKVTVPTNGTANLQWNLLSD